MVSGVPFVCLGGVFACLLAAACNVRYAHWKAYSKSCLLQ